VFPDQKAKNQQSIIGRSQSCNIVSNKKIKAPLLIVQAVATKSGLRLERGKTLTN